MLRHRYSASSQRMMNATKLTRFEREETKTFLDEIHYIPSTQWRYRPTQGSFDDKKGWYICVPGEHLNYRYEITGELGSGTFADVVEAFDHKIHETVAVKIYRNIASCRVQGLAEADLLRLLAKHDSDQRLIVMRDSFIFRNHVCIVFEILSCSIKPLPNLHFGLDEFVIKSIVSDVLRGLALLHKNSVIHGDVKPDNILFKNASHRGAKLIDFGCSMRSSELLYGVAQSRLYRAPEVILDAGFQTPIDIWSLGCVVAELFTGHPLFHGKTDNAQLILMTAVLGSPPPFMVSSGRQSSVFFNENNELLHPFDSFGVRVVPGSVALAELLPGLRDEEMLDFIAKCLKWYPAERMTAAEALRHSFFRRGSSLSLLSNCSFAISVDKL